MKIDLDLTQVLKGFEGENLVEKMLDGKGEGPLTLRKAILFACKTAIPSDNDLNLVAKVEIGMIGSALGKGLELTTEQIVAAKERCGKVYLSPELIWSISSALKPD